jgi:sugar lactone lactonase YvrE
LTERLSVEWNGRSLALTGREEDDDVRGAAPATDAAFELAEGPTWDAAHQRLRWVDIPAGAVHEGTLADGRIEVTGGLRVAGTAGAVAAADDGTLVVAGQEALLVVHPDGTRREGPRVVPAGAGRRLNDGAVDPAGRFLVGTLSLAEVTGAEVLVRWDREGALTVLDDDLHLSNGLGWSADGRTLYSVDTLRGTVFARPYDPGDGSAGPRRVHALVDGGLPDGLAVDAEDHLWLAVWGAGEVRRLGPDGRVVARLAVPAPHTSSVAFAGEDLRTLVITTAREDLSDAELAAAPDSGRLFTARADVPGLPLPPWRPPPA